VAERQMVVHLEIVHCKNFIHRYIECSFCLPVSYETGSSETVDSKKIGSITGRRVLANELLMFFFLARDFNDPLLPSSTLNRKRICSIAFPTEISWHL